MHCDLEVSERLIDDAISLVRGAGTCCRLCLCSWRCEADIASGRRSRRVRTAQESSPDDFLYVPGKGAKDASGKIPADTEGQLRNVLENIKVIVEAAGLTMEHVVYTQVYLTEYADEGPLNRVFKQYFRKFPRLARPSVWRSSRALPSRSAPSRFGILSKKKAVIPPNYPASSR